MPAMLCPKARIDQPNRHMNPVLLPVKVKTLLKLEVG